LKIFFFKLSRKLPFLQRQFILFYFLFDDQSDKIYSTVWVRPIFKICVNLVIGWNNSSLLYLTLSLSSCLSLFTSSEIASTATNLQSVHLESPILSWLFVPFLPHNSILINSLQKKIHSTKKNQLVRID
jgi:hypothetical protein